MKMTPKERKEQLKQIYLILEEKGYDPLGQLVGYLVSGDPTYITNNKNARTRITELDRHQLLIDITEYYFR